MDVYKGSVNGSCNLYPSTLVDSISRAEDGLGLLSLIRPRRLYTAQELRLSGW